MSSPYREALLLARPYYPALTGVRALAAYLVFVLHARSPAMPPWHRGWAVLPASFT
ncbi:hypothetical protein [Hymenobacter sp. UYCo722]|uniref:hypothetical protein n=1 Tax=Hymenobacter sp. UYCo722 TaxID=3156335 RepID=UPI00339359F8